MRVLVMAHPGTNSRDIFLDAARGFESAGCEVVRWEIEPLQRLSRRAPPGPLREGIAEDIGAHFASFVESNRVDFSFGLWANGLLSLPIGKTGGRLASTFELIGHDHVAFWLDAPHWAHGGGVAPLFGTPVVASDRLHHVINNPATADEMRRVLGFGRVFARGYGIDTGVFSPREGVSPRFDVVFGSGPGDPEPTAFELAELEKDEPDVAGMRAERAEVVRAEAVRAARSWAWPAGVDGGAVPAVVSRLVTMQVDDPAEPMLARLERVAGEDAALAGGVRALVSDPVRFVEATAKARKVEAARRAFTVAYICKRMRCAVFGQGGFEGWPVEAERLGFVGYREMSDAYAAGKLGLNVMRWQDEVGLNLKALEISASGRACLCERRAGLSDAFEPGAEVADFGSPAEAVELARALVGDDARRERMAGAALARVRAQHTWGHWARDVVRFVSERSA